MPCTQQPTPPKTSDQLELIKSLAGQWEGISEGISKETGKEENTPAKVEYRLTSGGTAVEEKLFSGTPHEMVSMYHDIKGKLSMTHYCMLGNQPQLGLTETAPGKILLNETPASAAVLEGQMRMASLSIEWSDKDNIIQTWQGVGADGKALPPTVIKLKRVAA